MAGTRKRGSANGKASESAAATAYIVLQAVVTGDGAPEAWAPVLNTTAEQGPDLQPRIFRAASKQAAIRQHTGDGPDVLEGTWRAVPLSSWRGGVTTRRVTAAERLPLD